MNFFVSVRNEHLNGHGFLFGGALLYWIDDFGGTAVSCEFSGRRFVTIGLTDVKFIKPINNGAVLCFNYTQFKIGETSVTYKVNVTAVNYLETEKTLAATAQITFVCVDNNNVKQAINKAC